MVDDRVFKRADELEAELGTHPILIQNVDLGSILSAFDFMAHEEYEMAVSFIKFFKQTYLNRASKYRIRNMDDYDEFRLHVMQYATMLEQEEDSRLMQTKIDYVRNINYARTINKMTHSCDPGLPIDLMREEPDRETVSLREEMTNIFGIHKPEKTLEPIQEKKNVVDKLVDMSVKRDQRVRKRRPRIGEVINHEGQEKES